ncbi:MAG: prepilin-type N-terminal cleavage/methylation domain-containing protein [Elusimicrobiota bacterium]|nr:prepilin-type N-terminal cleavage/methylation domain-containing protein [Elusimicrobiota bacterium]
MKDIIKKKGFTLIELMIVVAILGIVVLGLTKVFKTFLDSWWLSRTKLTTQEDAREAAYWIVKEFKGGRRTTLGSIVLNSGFEEGSGDNVAYFWDIDYVSALDPVERRHSSSEVASTATVRTGEYSLEITDFKSTGLSKDFESKPFDITNSTDYLLSGWFRIEGATVNAFGIKDSGGGIDLSVPNTTPPSEGEWVNFSTTGIINRGTDYYLFVNYESVTETDTIYIDDVSLTPVRWVMIDDTGINVQRSTYYYTTQTGAGGETEGILHAMVAEEIATSDGDKNRLVRKRFTQDWSVDDYNAIYNAGNWRTIGFNALADNISYLSFTQGGASKDTPVNISIKVTGTPTGGTEQEFDVRTQVYPLTE